MSNSKKNSSYKEATKINIDSYSDTNDSSSKKNYKKKRNKKLKRDLDIHHNTNEILSNTNDELKIQKIDLEQEKLEKNMALAIFYPWEHKLFFTEPLDLCSVRPWEGWCSIEMCKVCKAGPFSLTYEIGLEWGDTKNYEYISEICPSCLHALNVTHIRNKSNKY